MTTAESIGLLALLLICSFFLSGLESAILSVSKVRIRHAAKSTFAVPPVSFGT